jgi:hypothetical protein
MQSETMGVCRTRSRLARKLRVHRNTVYRLIDVYRIRREETDPEGERPL